jgi:hypothetical protein
VGVRAETEALSHEEYLKWQKKIEAEEKAFEESETKILSTSSDGSVMGLKGNRMFVGYNPKMVHSTRCKYCGSRNISDCTCNQCGAPVW